MLVLNIQTQNNIKKVAPSFVWWDVNVPKWAMTGHDSYFLKNIDTSVFGPCVFLINLIKMVL
jgi:hypothetical protein